ncbi:DeoR/GlpR family DNA-binding transcription regulator [Kribbella hippodromi]|uniref:DeoR/GlpR family DNA-binding transcription regulator n=1 Tax=Kribbella hippodromi TaxID=434347 RepID=A0ABN2DJD5_9ACTN
MTRLPGADRRADIVRRAKTVGLGTVAELAAVYQVATSTIRRDLAELTRAGELARTYGGAIPILTSNEASMKQRLGEAFEAKRAIARRAAADIQPGETVLLDAGSTVSALAHELRTSEGVTVVTTSLDAMVILAEAPQVHVECLGGTLRHLSQGLVGPLTEIALERMTFDRVFLGGDGISAFDGICEADLRQTRIKEVMAAQSAKTYVLAHAAKLGHRPFHAWAPLPTGWTLITDTTATPESLAPFHNQGVDVQVAPALP